MNWIYVNILIPQRAHLLSGMLPEHNHILLGCIHWLLPGHVPFIANVLAQVNHFTLLKRNYSRLFFTLFRYSIIVSIALFHFHILLMILTVVDEVYLPKSAGGESALLIIGKESSALYTRACLHPTALVFFVIYNSQFKKIVT